MKSLIDRIPDRPVYFDLRNQLRRFAGGSLKGNQVASLVVLLIFFSMIAYSFLSAAKYVPLGAVTFMLPGLAWLTIPGSVSGLIAGELQKRSLDPLLAAPLHSYELVRAKALRALPVALMLYGAAVGLVLLLTIGKLFQGDETGSEVMPAPLTLFMGTVIFAATAFGTTGLSMAVSSVARSTVAALITCLGLIIGLYAVLPAVVVPVFAALSSDSFPYLMALHPYGAISLCTFTMSSVQINWMLVAPLIGIGLAVQWAMGWFGLAFASSRIEQLTKKGTGVS